MSVHTSLILTRYSLHALAEHVMAPAVYASTGRIGLRQSKGGFCTPELALGKSTWQIKVVGTELSVREGDHHPRNIPITTLRHASQHVGIEAGAPADVYTPVTPLDIDAQLTVDPPSAKRIADWYALVQTALEWMCEDLVDHEPTEIQLWPEHFDLATTIAEVNLGGSPGDGHQELPYLYVGPWTPPELEGEFWNESFGASRLDTEITSVDQAIAFLEEGWERAQALRQE